ncbi:hypothetical protein HAX54_050554 [Datura stramonium]|uniref:Uncharacterized protein n=1 Tax=Datura stramonium TaxID=4076 RepID=A0ABS8WRA3_DATST|nr:hypothetical protein [Datura stramonium]
MYQWILRQQRRIRVTAADMMTYLQPFSTGNPCRAANHHGRCFTLTTTLKPLHPPQLEEENNLSRRKVRDDSIEEAEPAEAELDYSGEDHSMSPRQLQNQHSQPMHFANSGFPVSSGSIGASSSRT